MPAQPIRVFLSHDWGTNKSNHERVKKLVPRLRQRNIEVWFDDDDMQGEIVDAMTKGIDMCDVFLAFLTSNYIAKVNGKKKEDNARKEFRYACNRAKEMVGIRFDTKVPSKTHEWEGVVGDALAGWFYVDMAYEHISDTQMDDLALRIRQAIQSGKGRHCEHTACKV